MGHFPTSCAQVHPLRIILDLALIVQGPRAGAVHTPFGLSSKFELPRHSEKLPVVAAPREEEQVGADEP